MNQVTQSQLTARINKFLDKKTPLLSNFAELQRTSKTASPRGRKIEVQVAPFIAT